MIRTMLNLLALTALLVPADDAVGSLRVPATNYALSAIPWVSGHGGLGPVEINSNVGGPAAGDGTPLIVNGQTFAAGFGTHATSVIAFDLGGIGHRFSTWVGVDDAVGESAGSVIFQVIADGVPIYDSGVMTGADPARFTGLLPVDTIQELLLVVTDADDGSTADHADWGDPVLAAFDVPGGDGALSRYVRGSWGPVLPWPVKAMHAMLLPTGHVLSHASASPTDIAADDPTDPHDSTRVDLAEISTWSHQFVAQQFSEMYSAGHVLLPDGNLLEAGGHTGVDPSMVAFGSDRANRFEPATNTWVPTASMTQPRWQPATVSLGNGHVLAIGGAHAGGNSFVPEVYDGCGWRTVANVDYATWLSPGDPVTDHTYPFVHLAPDGRLFWAGWDEDMAFFDVTGNGNWDVVQEREPRQRAWGTFVPYRTNRVVLAGGVDHQGNPGEATKSAVRVSLTSLNVIELPPMLFPRADADGTLLADGTVMVSGGGTAHADGASPSHAFHPEIWDPVENEWTLGAAATHPRGYRSTALLLPDGRVWTAGGECGDGCGFGETAQVYSPPYLYVRTGLGELADRPVIESAPDEVGYGESFQATVTATGGVSRVTLVGYGTSTHGKNFGQRFLEPDFDVAGSTVTIDAPDHGNLAPPGHYMLFVFDGPGIPSVAHTLRLTEPAPTAWDIVDSPDGSEPTERHEAGLVEVGGELYLMGGRGNPPIERFDPVTKVWEHLGNAPFDMHHFQPVVYDGLVWVVGAFKDNFPGETPLDDVHIYDPSDNSWTVGPPMPAARNRGSAGAALYDGKIYLVGGNTMGHNGGYVPWFDVFDPETGVWTPLPDAPHARDHFTAVVIGNKLVAAGGRRTDLPNPFDKTIPEVDVYDFAANTWTTITNDIPTERAGTMSVGVGQFAIVIGGESSGMSQAHEECEALDVLTGEWLLLPDLVQDRHSGGAGRTGDLIWVASGSGGQGGGPELDTVEVLGVKALLDGASANLVANSGFDAGLAGWGGDADMTLTPDGNIESPALVVENGAAEYEVAAAPGATYTLHVVYQAQGAGNLTLGMEYLSGGGTELGDDTVSLSQASQYTSAQVAGTTPAGTATVRVTLFADGPTLVVDDVALLGR